MKKILMIGLFFVIVSCHKPDLSESNVKLQIINNELYFGNKYNDLSIYPNSYVSSTDRNYASNVVTWKITNLSNENYLFVLNEDEFFKYPFGNRSSYLIEILDKSDKKRSVGFSDVTWSDSNSDVRSLIKYTKTQDSIKRSRFMLKHQTDNYNFLQDEYTQHSFVLHPNESKTFKSIITLPLFREADRLTDAGPIAFRDLEEGDKFRITYQCNSVEFEKALDDYQIEELKNNKTKIFNGKLVSNMVPLKGR